MQCNALAEWGRYDQIFDTLVFSHILDLDEAALFLDLHIRISSHYARWSVGDLSAQGRSGLGCTAGWQVCSSG